MASYTIDYLEEMLAVRVVTAGRFERADHEAFVVAALAEAERRGSRKFLVDDREMDHGFHFVDLYQWPRELKRMGLTAGMRVAIVFAADGAQAHDFRFFEDVSFNHGLPLLRVFTDYDEAQDWLRLG
jgi:hypothetical protein